jgi:broad specificity phosphatase PhoE
MTKIYLLRHGETAWNITKVFRGRAEVPLTDNGRKQAEYAAQFLVNKGIKAIYSSPLSRALETAQAVGKALNLEPIIDGHLTGLNFGPWQGRPYEEIEKEYPDQFHLYKTEPHLFRIQGGETLDEAMQRGLAVVKDVEKRHPKDTVLLVTHRVIYKLILLGILGLDSSRFWQLKPDTASVSEFDTTPGGYVIIKFNDTSFLREAERVTEDF